MLKIIGVQEIRVCEKCGSNETHNYKDGYAEQLLLFLTHGVSSVLSIWSCYICISSLAIYLPARCTIV